MLFDVQAALSEILSTPLAAPAGQFPEAAPVARVREPAAIPAPAKVLPFTPLPSAPDPSREDPDAFRHGRSPDGRPRTWTGRVVSLDEWRKLSTWDRHGPDGRLFCGICRAWVSDFPACHGEGQP